MTLRERKFVEVFKGNATEAAIEAGYKTSAARVMASRLLAKPAIREAIERRMSCAAKRAGVVRSDIVGRLWELALLAPEATGGNITGQVRAADALADILGMKVQRMADLTKQFEGRSEDELEFFAQHGYWPVDAARPGVSRSEGIRTPPPDTKEIN